MIGDGRFGRFGGFYVAEPLLPALEELEAAWLDAREDPAFRAELDGLLHDYAGRPTPLYRSPALSGSYLAMQRQNGEARRVELTHTAN